MQRFVITLLGLLTAITLVLPVTAELTAPANDSSFQQPTATPLDPTTTLVETITVARDDVLNTVYETTPVRLTTDSDVAFIGVNEVQDGEAVGVVYILPLTETASLSTGRLTLPNRVFDIAVTTYNDTPALAVGVVEGDLIYYDLTNNLTEIASLDNVILSYSARLSGFAFSPDGSFIATSRCSDAVCISTIVTQMDAQTGETLWSQDVNRHHIEVLAYSADSTRLVTGGDFFVADGPNSGDVRVWNTETGEEIGRYTSDDMLPITDIDINANTAQIIFANCATLTRPDYDADCTQGRVGLLDGNTIELQSIVNAFEDVITSVAYAPDDTRFAVASGAMIQLHNSTSGILLETITLPLDDTTPNLMITSLAYGDATLMVSASNGLVYQYALSTEDTTRIE